MIASLRNSPLNVTGGDLTLNILNSFFKISLFRYYLRSKTFVVNTPVPVDRYPYRWYTILLGATRALAHIGVHFTHRVFGLSGSPGCANTISGRGTGLTPGPESMSTASANYGWKLGCATVERTASNGSGMWLKTVRAIRDD